MIGITNVRIMGPECIQITGDDLGPKEDNLSDT